MWVLAPHSDAATPVEEQRIQSQNLVQALQKTYLLLPDADNVLSRLPNAFSSMTSNPSSSTPRPFRPIKILEQSISGSHATLNFSRPDSIDDPDARPEVTLTDKSSYGSWVNGMRIHRTAKRLSEGDLLEFGGNRLVKFYLRYHPLVVTVSGVSEEVKASLALTVGKLGGHVVSDWRRNVSTHCCMESISVTIKTVSAMVALKPVVTPGYFDAYLTAALKDVDASTASPDVADFLPEVSDSQLTGRNDMSFLIRRSRATVFQGKTFYFFDRKQFKKCFAVVEMGGGDPILVEDADALKKATLEKMVQENAIVMQPNPDRASQSFATSVQQALDKKQRRWIDTPEIGYAIIYSSTQLFANPTVRDPMSVWAQGGSATEKRDGRGDDRDHYAADEEPATVSAPKRQKLSVEGDFSSSTPTTRSPLDDSDAPSSAVETSATANPPAVLADDSFIVPDTLPTQPRNVVQSTELHSGVPEVPSKEHSNAAAAVETPQSASAAPSVKPSSVFKRLLNADSDDDDIDNEEEEKRRKKMKMERDEEFTRNKEEKEEKKRLEAQKQEEEGRLRKENREVEEEEEEEERERKRREKDKEEEEQKRREEEIRIRKEKEEEEQKRRKEEIRLRKEREEEEQREKELKELKEKELEEKEQKRKDELKRREYQKEREERNPREAEEEEKKKGEKKKQVADEDFSDYDVDEAFDEMDDGPPVDSVERKPDAETSGSVISRPIGVENHGGSNNGAVKQEVPSQLAVNDDDQPVADGWIRKPTKTRTNVDENGVSLTSLGMMVEEMNLVVRRARVAAVNLQGGSDGNTQLPRVDNRGMPIKNFKRFKKSTRRNYQDVSRMVIDLVPVAMNAAPPETFQPNTLSSTASFNQTGRTSSLSNGVATTFNGSRSSVATSSSTTNGVSLVGRSNVSNGITTESDKHPNFDVDFGEQSAVNGHSSEAPQQPQSHPVNGAINQAPDEFFDFDF